MCYILASCDDWECKNGGSCIENDHLPPHYAECECADEYEGEHCEIGDDKKISRCLILKPMINAVLDFIVIRFYFFDRN